MSSSKEVAVTSRIVGRDARTVTGLNLLNIRLETGETHFSKSFKVKKKIYNMYFNSPTEDEWRVNLLFKYIRLDEKIPVRGDYIDVLIDFLCSR